MTTSTRSLAGNYRLDWHAQDAGKCFAFVVYLGAERRVLMEEPGLFASGTTFVPNLEPASYSFNVTSTCETWSLTLTPE